MTSSTTLQVPNDVTFAGYILGRIKSHGSRVALIDSSTNSQITFAEVHKRILSTGTALRARGLRKGHVVCLYCGNSINYPIIWLAASSIGGVITTANPAYNVDELAHQINDCKASIIIADQNTHQHAHAAAAKSSNNVQVITCDSDSDVIAALTSPSANGVAERSSCDSNVKPEDLFAILYSSGTTGLPKGVMLTHRNMLFNLVKHVVAEERGIVDGSSAASTHLVFVPLFHIFGFNTLMTSLFLGDTSVVMPRFNLAQLLAAIQRYKVTTLPLVPPIAVMLAKDPQVSLYDLSSVTSISCGAASINQETTDLIFQRLRVTVQPAYGMTECSGMITFTPKKQCKRGSTGVVAPLTEVKIVDVTSGVQLGVGNNGEICVRSGSIMKGYLNNDTATRNTIDNDGWLHTGDIGHLDEDGHVYITGRIKELIKYKGFQVAPVELEGILLEHPSVADVAVVGVPDAAAGELPKALIIKKDGCSVSESEIINYLRERVAPYKRLRGGVEFVTSIPKSPSGKILRLQIVTEQKKKRQLAAAKL